MHTEKLISKAGTELPWGIKLTVDSYEETVALGKDQLTKLVYDNRFLVIKGMKGVSKLQFWELCNMFGGGCWTKEDYNVGREENFPIGDGSDKVFAFYSNHGKTAKAIGDAEMSWHVDIPLWPSHKAPLRAFYATSIPDNKYGITRFADRAYGYKNMTEAERQEAEHWQLLYQSWYEPGTSLTYLPVVDESPYDKEKYLQFTSFSNSGKPYSHYAHGWKVHGWVFGAKRDEVPYNADYVSFLHEKTIVDENIFENAWTEEDFVIYTNVHMIHDRTPLKSEMQTKPREFFRLNVFNSWQK
jgi:alpha-ketoglutarate-dependent taurine dioxygenase